MRGNLLGRLAAWVLLIGLASVSTFAAGLPKATSSKAEAQRLIEQAWRLDHSQFGTAAYSKCLDLLKQADKLDPRNPEILNELSRLSWKYGDSLPRTDEDQCDRIEEIYGQGMAYAEQSLEIKPTAGAHYWHAINHSATLEFRTLVGQAAAFPTIYGHVQYLLENRPDYFYGAPNRLWIDIISRMPRTVVESQDWDLEQSLKDLDRFIAEEPRFLENYLTKARFYFFYHDDKAAALQLIEHILKQDPKALPEEAMTNQVTQTNARKLWKEITGRECPGPAADR